MDKKNYKWLILLLFVLFGIFYFIYDFNRSLYYNNYYEINKVNLNKIVNYIEGDNLDGYIYIYGEPSNWGGISDKKNGLSLGECYENKECLIGSRRLIDLLKEIKIQSIYIGSDYISFRTNHDIYSEEDFLFKEYSQDNFLYYSKGFYSDKDELDKIDGNRAHVVFRKFNDDWGVINGCYFCGTLPFYINLD